MKQGTDSRRRTTVKALVWRFIGIFWTWGGAFVILIMLPEPSRKNPLLVATLITAWHHSTRMIMYYGYERVWDKISWGRNDNSSKSLSLKLKLTWIITVIILIFIIFWLLMGVTPQIKKFQKKQIESAVAK